MVHPAILGQLPLFRGLHKPVLDYIARHAEVQVYKNNELIAHQNGRACTVFFLLSGSVQYLIRIEGRGNLLVGVGRDPGLIVGWSAFCAPYRYTASVRCEQECRCVCVPRDVFDQVRKQDRASGLVLLRRVAGSLALRLEHERDRLLATEEGRARIYALRAEVPNQGQAAQPTVRGEDPSEAQWIGEFLAQTPLFQHMHERYRRLLAEQAFVQSLARGDSLFTQGQVAENLYLLISGKIGLSYMNQSSGAQLFQQTLSRGGELLGWSALVEPRRYRDTCTAQEPARCLGLPRSSLERLCDQEPVCGISLFQKVLQCIGSRLRSNRVRWVARRYAKETRAVRVLLDQAVASMHLGSPLRRIPYLLEDRLTLANAARKLEHTQRHGDAGERRLAGRCLDVLQDVNREIDFYWGLQTAYESVANAPPELSPEALRRRSMEVFIKVFRYTPYRIRGEENLPSISGNIVIMNHLENHPDNRLPNELRLTLDTNFVSSMVLYRRYGDAPIHLLRMLPLDWHGHQQYFDRLDYIYVYAGEADQEEQNQPVTCEARFPSFFERAAAHLRAGRNLVITPEASCSCTENSPGPFNSGAFRLAACVQPEPLIIPVAVANFDKKVTQVTAAAVIYPPFQLSNYVSDPENEKALRSFLDSLQENYRHYVGEAIRLAQA